MNILNWQDTTRMTHSFLMNIPGSLTMKILCAELTAYVSETAHLVGQQRFIVFVVNIAKFTPTFMLCVFVIVQVDFACEAHAAIGVRTWKLCAEFCRFGCGAGVHWLAGHLVWIGVIARRR